ncbi:MAG: hypothetical protein A3J63_02370 [Candidatus Moranbacteria bacterium RIFCSPHIGHO2_02_FULL_40_12b]|nr:MAG: hypothetical protein A3J63_02370 [Candidatus Moranbacteria bacterium RIFCSPHIGHO2_02_FULL_40_12b]
MTLKSYLWGMRLSTFVTFIAWCLTVYYIDPEKAGILGQALFYLTLFLFLTGLFTLFFSFLRRKISAEGNQSQLGMNFREGALISLMAAIFLFFQNKAILVWWDGLLVIAAVLLLELYFLTRQNS